jgi:hypothetical protein
LCSRRIFKHWCWQTDPSIKADQARGGTLSQLLERYVRAVHPQVTSKNRTAVYWEDVLLDAAVNVSASAVPRETTILQTWNDGPNNTKRIVRAGYRSIVSSASFYYLDCGHGNNGVYDDPNSDFDANGGSWCGPYKTWQRVYDYDIAYGLTADEARLVIGGEVALWTEQVDTTVVSGRGRRRWRRRCGPATATRLAGSGTRMRQTGSSTGGTAWWAGASGPSPSSRSGAARALECATWSSNDPATSVYLSYHP